MKPRVSKLRHTVTFQRNTDMPDGLGGISKQWLAAGETVGDYQPINARRALDAQATEVMHRATLRIRAMTLPPSFDAKTWRVVVAGGSHTILSKLDEDGDGRFLAFIIARAA